MESPSSTARRLAWAHGSRQGLPLEEPDPQARPPLPPPPPSCTHLHHPPTGRSPPPEGCCAGNIESWLQGCGLETSSGNISHLSAGSVCRASSSFEDQLSLGAEATVLDVELEEPEMGSCPLLLPPPKARQKGLTSSSPRQSLSPLSLHLTSSAPSSSSSSSFTASSVSEVLRLHSEDAEETLIQLGFGRDEPQVTARVPPRFLRRPSALGGIDLRLFLQSQLRRLREEDPDLSLASRFRQVEVLTAMANAFYSLYSHVSRTPVQKLAPPPQFGFPPSSSSPLSSATGPWFLAGGVRASEPRSPVDRLKDTVSKMCLYTRGGGAGGGAGGGGAGGGGASSSPQTSPRKRSGHLPDVVEPVLGESPGGSGALPRERRRRALDMGGGGAGEGGVGEEVRGSSPADSSGGGVTLGETPAVPGGEECGAGLSHAPSCAAQSQRPQRPEEEESAADEAGAGSEVAATAARGTEGRPGDARPRPPPSSLSSSSPPPHAGGTPCRITVTGWEGDDGGVASCTAPVLADPEARGSRALLSAVKPRARAEQKHSFELEEVVSGGEEDLGEEETPRVPSVLRCSGQHKGPVVRGDSVQSDSSGYAEDDVRLSHSSPDRTGLTV